MACKFLLSPRHCGFPRLWLEHPLEFKAKAIESEREREGITHKIVSLSSGISGKVVVSCPAKVQSSAANSRLIAAEIEQFT